MSLDPSIPIFIMGPAINPLAYKNIPLTRPFIDATLEKYGIKKKGQPAPPLVMQVSRFDPYKGPLEVITSFIEMVADLEDKNLREKIQFVYVGSFPGDNPLGIKLMQQIKDFINNIPVEELPAHMRGQFDIRRRINIICPEEKNKYEFIVKLIGEFTKLSYEQSESIYQTLLKNKGLSNTDMLSVLKTEGLIDPKTAEQIKESEKLKTLSSGTSFSHAQKKAVVDLMRELKRSEQELQRAQKDELTGKEMADLEVNVFQAWAQARVQFSSKEGFGLVVAEAMIALLKNHYGVMVATTVGGIKTQINKRTGIPIHYEQADIDASLKMYQWLGSQNTVPEEKYKNLFKEIRNRFTVKKFANGMQSAMTMPESKRKEINTKAYEHISDNFFTFSNIENMIKLMLLALLDKPSIQELEGILKIHLELLQPAKQNLLNVNELIQSAI